MIRLIAAVMFMLAAFEASAADGLRLAILNGGYGHSGTQILAGLRVDMDPGWHAYWRSPGEAGLPPEIAVSGDNIGSGRIYLPIPERFLSAGFETLGYRRSFVIPVVASVADPSRPTVLSAKGTLYACSDICVPFPVDLSVQVAPGHKDSAAASEIAGWLARSPGGGKSDVRLVSAAMEGGDLVATFTSGRKMAAPTAFLDLGMQGFGSLKSLDLQEDDTAVARFGITSLRAIPPDMSAARIVIYDGVSPPAETGLAVSSGSIAAILAVSFIGGLILNAMPCVFPVLAIKLLLLVTADRRTLRTSLMALACGVVAAFLCIGVALAALKGAGHAVGWGMQFQQHAFLAAMALVLCLFGAGTAGAFHVILPSRFATAVTSATDGEGIWKSFLQGVVVTLLATPCSAPFVGTAVSYGLSSGTEDILPVFLLMGAGMASPLVVLAMFPRLAALLPRPGRWMEHVKNATSAAMFGTSGWLIYLLYATGSGAALTLACLAAVLAAVAVGFSSLRLAALLAVALLVAPAMFSIPQALSPGEPIEWNEFDKAAIERAVAEGRTVFIDITADWCLTCKVNERGVLSTREVSGLISENTVPFRGDWTTQDDRISGFLKEHGRYGIPFYLVIGPEARNGIVLPELLTRDAVRTAIETAKGDARQDS